ncbi:MAG: hypothetical protein ACRENK_15680 [Gemmatimonadaceae bacterium]
MTVPKREPDTIRAGDTWQWRREDLANNYPAPTWTLSYVFKNATKGFGFDAGADGAFFSVDLPASETEGMPAGSYRWAAQVRNGDERHTVGIGTTEVLADVFTDPDAAADLRSHNRIVLDAIRAVIEKRATRDQERYSISGRELWRTPIADLRALRAEYEALVAADEDGEKPVGSRRGRNAYVRFGRAV